MSGRGHAHVEISIWSQAPQLNLPGQAKGEKDTGR